MIRSTDDPALTDSQKVTIFALRNEGAASRLFQSKYTKGMYTSRVSGAFAFVPLRMGQDGSDFDTETVFFHEYAHHLQLQYAHTAIPQWMSEGFAEFYATAKVERNGSVVIGHPPQYRAYGVFQETGLPLEQMLGVTYGKLSDGEWDRLYGMGWLMTHYLAFTNSRRGQLTRYLDAIQKGTSAADAAKMAFGDLRQLDRELRKYARGKIMGLRIPPEKTAPGPIAVRPLRPGEAAMMNVVIRSKFGVNEKTAPIVAAEARTVARSHPDEPAVQSALAEAEYDVENYAGALAAADKAIAADPKRVHALIYKGRALMELAKQQPKTADWKSVRSWFKKANAVDHENAEALMLFFESYWEAGQEPTKNAGEALLYAVELAPQDGGLRMMAVQYLVQTERYDEAGRLFGPMAFQVHASKKWRDTAANIMTAIGARQSEKAIALLAADHSETEE